MSQLTKKELANSLKKLMATTPLEKITVKDVVADCGVNRQTFYYHFHDIYELLGWIYTTEAVGSIAEYKSYETWQQGFLKIFHYVEANKKVCANTLHSLGREHLELFLYQVTFDLLMGVINEVSQESGILEKDKKFIADFYSFAFIGLLISWMKAGMKDDPEHIIEDLTKLIEGDIGRAIKKHTQG